MTPDQLKHLLPDERELLAKARNGSKGKWSSGDGHELMTITGPKTAHYLIEAWEKYPKSGLYFARFDRTGDAIYIEAAQPSAVLDLLTRLAAARADAQRHLEESHQMAIRADAAAGRNANAEKALGTVLANLPTQTQCQCQGDGGCVPCMVRKVIHRHGYFAARADAAEMAKRNG